MTHQGRSSVCAHHFLATPQNNSNSSLNKTSDIAPETIILFIMDFFTHNLNSLGKNKHGHVSIDSFHHTFPSRTFDLQQHQKYCLFYDSMGTKQCNFKHDKDNSNNKEC